MMLWRGSFPVLALWVVLSAQMAMAQQRAPDPEALAAQAALRFGEAADALDRAQDRAASDRIAALTQAIRAYEDGLAALRAGQRIAAQRTQTLESVFAARRAELGRLLSILTAIERAPRPALVLHPEGPLAGARAGMLLSEVAPALGRDVDTVRAALEELQTMRDVQSGAASRLEEGLAGMQEARLRLAQAVADRGPLPMPVAQDPVAMRRLLQSADTLDSFAQGLVSVPAAAPPGQVQDGPLPWPVRGLRLRGFWEIDQVGIARPGWLVATAPGALVTAPFAATVRYVGPLLDFGMVVVLEPEAGSLLILAGLGGSFVQTGEVSAPGAPLGLMPGAQESQAEVSGASAGETLYMEWRVGAQPVDPADWFAPDGSGDRG
jgi:septal ring factor EnvC (AmiA/AmiB activator)